MLVGCFLQPTAQAQDRSSNRPTNSYFLDNFKASVDIALLTGMIDWSPALQEGLGFGYYLLKFKHTQLGLLILKKLGKSNHETISIDAGDGLISLEIGIRYPEKQLLRDLNTFQIEEKSLVFPITMQLAWPDFFAGGTYTTFFLSFNSKYLLASAYTPIGNTEHLNTGFRTPI